MAWLAALALAGGGYWGYQKWQASKAEDASAAAQDAGATKAKGKGKGRRPVAPVAVARARSGPFNVYLNSLGTVTPLRTVTVRSRVDGQLMRVLFTEGQQVQEGQLLAEIDPRSFQAQLTQAEGQLQRDQALLANARVDLERYSKLLEQDSIAEQQVASQRALVRQYEGVVKVDQGQVDNARLQLSYTRITAPIAGKVGLRLVDPGNIVRSGDASGLVVITQDTPAAVLFTIPQDNLPEVLKELKAGEKIAVDVYDREQKVKLGSGQLLTADNQIDTTTGTVRLKALLPNNDGALFPNQFVNVRMLVDTRENAITVPTSSVQRGAQGLFVYVVDENQKVFLRQVKTGVTEGTRVEILSGVNARDRVVIDGTDRLRDGMQVEIAERRNFDAKGKSGKGKGRRGKGAEAAGQDAAKGDGTKAASESAGDKPPRAQPAEGAAAGEGGKDAAFGAGAKGDAGGRPRQADGERRKRQKDADNSAAQ
jgi:multidrug efflux system membrane fusion protein